MTSKSTNTRKAEEVLIENLKACDAGKIKPVVPIKGVKPGGTRKIKR